MAKTGSNGQLKRVDPLGRMTLGKKYANETYSVERLADGAFVLTPVAVIPKKEMWLWKDQEALSSLKDGLEQTAGGQRKYLGAFARHADERDTS